MGGMDDGQIASSTAVRTLTDNFAQQISQDTPQNTLLQLCARAQTAVRSYNERGGKNAGCTLVAVVLNRDDLSFISVGDSRICLQRGGALLQLNREHALGPESDERTATQGTAPVLEPARRRAITSHIGKDVFSKVDRNLRPIKLLPGDKLLLMSDGLFGALSDDEIRACLQDTPQQDAQRLTAAVAAKQLRGQDNATVVVVAYN
jgi:serine/threonine protein phosphatase PrpC